MKLKKEVTICDIATKLAISSATVSRGLQYILQLIKTPDLYSNKQ